MFDMCDTSRRPSLGFMQVVQSRDANTLLPIIQAHIHPGTVIYSDSWRAYSNVQSLAGVVQHHTVITLYTSWILQPEYIPKT